MLLKQIAAARNRKRFYMIGVGRTLFSEWSVQHEWGRIGSPGRVWLDTFMTEQEARGAEQRHAATAWMLRNARKRERDDLADFYADPPTQPRRFSG